MTIRFPEKWTRFLVQQPESGMGYQRVDVRLTDNREIKDAVVFNAEEIELPDRLRTQRDRRCPAAPLIGQLRSGVSALVQGQRCRSIAIDTTVGS